MNYFCSNVHENVLLCVSSLLEVERTMKLMKFYGLHYVEGFNRSRELMLMLGYVFWACWKLSEACWYVGLCVLPLVECWVMCFTLCYMLSCVFWACSKLWDGRNSWNFMVWGLKLMKDHNSGSIIWYHFWRI